MSKDALINLRKDLFAVEKSLFEDGLKKIMNAFRDLPAYLKDSVRLHSSVGKAARVFEEEDIDQVVWFNFQLDGRHNFFSRFDVEALINELPKDRKLTLGEVKKAKAIQEKINLVIDELEEIPFTGINKFKANVNNEKVVIGIL